MYRLGIVGSDNSHADRYCQIFNLDHPHHLEGAKVVAIYGPDPVRTREVATNGKIPEIVDSPLAMIGKVDAVTVVFRHGDLHLPYALPFIESGIPVFVDKPFCNRVMDCKVLVQAAQNKNVTIASYSALRYDQTMLELLESLKNIGQVVTGSISGPADIESEYGGLPFYGIHVSEMLLRVFGRGVKLISACNKQGDILAKAEYEDKIVSLNLLKRSKAVFHVLAFGTEGWTQKEIQVTDAFRNSMIHFLKMLDEKKPILDYGEMIESIRILEAIQESFLSGGRGVAL